MVKLGFAMCGSFCTHSASLKVMESFSKEYDITPILSYNAAKMNTRFGSAEELIDKIRLITGREPITAIEEAEKLGPSLPLDYMIVCPCTGNTAAKLAHGITDTPVTMAVKAHLRTNKPTLLALASNDAMSANFANIGRLLDKKNVYFVPMRQDDIVKKPHSLVAELSMVPEALENMKKGIQTRPLFL